MFSCVGSVPVGEMWFIYSRDTFSGSNFHSARRLIKRLHVFKSNIISS